MPGSLMEHPCCRVASCIGNLQPGDPQMGKFSQTKAQVDQHNMQRSMQSDSKLNNLKRKDVILLGYIQTRGVCAMVLQYGEGNGNIPTGR
jgi:hypothetical protein